MSKAMAAQLHMARGQKNEARDLLLSVDVSDFMHHAAVIRAEAPKSVVEPFQPIARFFTGLEHHAKRCVHPYVTYDDWFTSPMHDTSGVVENLNLFAAAVRATMRPAGDHDVDGLFIL
ncbi:hypothetical protein [Streptomyces sp. NPDC054940]